MGGLGEIAANSKLASILLLMVGMVVAAWIAVLCGIRAPIEKEKEG